MFGLYERVEKQKKKEAEQFGRKNLPFYRRPLTKWGVAVVVIALPTTFYLLMKGLEYLINLNP